MPYKLTVDVPNLGSQDLEIPGLGLFQNGTYDITDEQAASFQSSQPSYDEGGYDQDPKSPYFGSYIPKIVPGRDLMTAAETMHGITVEEVTGGGSGGSGSGDSTGTPPTGTETVDPTGSASDGESSSTTTNTNSPVGNVSLGPAANLMGGN